MSKPIHILIPAAGIGKRFNADRPKQYMPFFDTSVLDHCIAQLRDILDQGQFIVGLSKEDTWWPQSEAAKDKKIQSVLGGPSRAESVNNMLLALGAVDDQDWVLVHDVVRPCINRQSLQPLLDALELSSDSSENSKSSASSESSASGLSLGKPLYEAMKRVSDDGRVLQSEDRHGLWATQTPQVFRYSALKHALTACIEQGLSFDDEMMALHHLGYATSMVEGPAWNIKITKSQDLSLAETYWQLMQASK